MMEARSDGVISDKVLQQEVLNRRLHMERIRKFVVEKRISAPSVFNDKNQKVVALHLMNCFLPVTILIHQH